MEPKSDLSCITSPDGGISITLSPAEDTVTLDDTITITDSATFDYSSFSNTVIGGGTTYPYTISTGTGIASPWVSTTAYPYLGNGVCTDGNNSGKIKLTGDNADVEINGVSLVESIRKIEERLNILAVNPELEKEWEELRELGNRYRELEQHIKEKQATWDRLTAMPKPEID